MGEIFMNKKKEELIDFAIDTEEVANLNSSPVVSTVAVVPLKVKTAERRDTSDLINCLQNKIITVLYIPQPCNIVEKNHVLAGGMAERSFVIVTVPRLRSGTYVNVLTDSEKDFLEAVLGLEKGAMNVYNRENNFWSNATEDGVSKVRLTKQDTRLNLADPIDYIKYKILLANKDLIAPNLETLRNKKKATYKFVLISDDDINSLARNKMTTKKRCYTEYGKIEENRDVLKAVIEIITGKVLANNTSLDFLLTKVGELIEANAEMFLSVVKDPTLATKILIKKAHECGLVLKKADYYYLAVDNSPMCENGEEPTLPVAARYLNHPKRQELKLTLEAKVNK